MAGRIGCIHLGGCQSLALCPPGLCRAQLQENHRAVTIQQTPRQDALDAVRTLLRFIGEDPNRPGLVETPQRVLKAWEEDWGAGYREPAKPLVKLFEEEGTAALSLSNDGQVGEMVTVDNIQLYSTCEHHMAPFYGTAAISYIPTKKGLIGISKLARVVDHFARRLQVQERLTAQIADYLVERLSPNVGIVIKCKHFCMISRGAKQSNASTITSALRGVFYADAKTRAEFLALTRGNNYSCD